MQAGASATVIAGCRPLGGPPTDVLIIDNTIAALGRDIDPPRAATVVDAAGCILLPGLVDLHTHLREPGGESSETIATGTTAAAWGGYTAVQAMANTQPVTDTPARAAELVARFHRSARVDVAAVGAVTKGLAGHELADLAGMADSAARVRMFSDDGFCVADPRLMREALRQGRALGLVIAQHAQDPSLTASAQVNEGVAAEVLGLGGWPSVAEDIIVARDCLLAADTGGRLHVCHVSTAGAVEVIRWAKSRGWPVTAEVTPHHLLLTDSATHSGQTRFKVNPPLRSDEDVKELRLALADGTIDAVATDHAPHDDAAKSCSWEQARPGMLGLETALSIVLETMVTPGLLSWAQLAERMSYVPARIAGLNGQGRPILAGEPANLTLIDAEQRWCVSPEDGHSKSNNSPYLGHIAHGSVIATWNHGKQIMTRSCL